MTGARAFDPQEHLTSVRGGGRYLPVKWRLVWFRDENPAGSVVTELVQLDRSDPSHGGFALFKATATCVIQGPDGTTHLATATGHGSETEADFRDYIEKAETKAIGRALGALGYGTEFADDFDLGDAIADAPVERNADRASPDTGDAVDWEARLARATTLRAATALMNDLTKAGVGRDDPIRTRVRERIERLRQGG